jgi:Carboxypeptidase regulatory-like domain
MKLLNLLALSLCLTTALSAQTLRGIIRNADNGAPIEGATLIAAQEPALNLRFEVQTGENGTFQIDNLRTGYYRCTISKEGAETLEVREVNIAAGKETVLELTLRISQQSLPNVTIVAAPVARRPLQPLGEIPLTREQTLRFPATFFDPARLAQAYAGVANTDDQANGLSIRGNSPNSLRWRLEGVDIVNPNHLPGAGTFTDRPAVSSGGVLLFSAQMLDNGSLLTGAFPVGYGDATGGVMDMYWRRGNAQHHEFTAQAGLLGLDLAAEGPLSKKEDNKHSYLVNYRYSTVGLLGQMGISFGGESIDFQDLSYKFSLGGRHGGQWSIFGVRGVSNNVFTRPDEATAYKDLFNIKSNSITNIHGISYWKNFGERSWYKASLVGSGQRNVRESSGPGLSEDNTDREIRFGLSQTWSYSPNQTQQFKAGLLSQLQDYYYYDRSSSELGGPLMLTFNPWIQWEWTTRNQRSQLQVGLQTTLIKFFYIDDEKNTDINLEPRLNWQYKLAPKHTVALALGLYSQTQPLWFYDYDYFDLMRAQHAGFQYKWQPNQSWQIKGELFWQYLTKIPMLEPSPRFSPQLTNVFSLINFPEQGFLKSLRDRFPVDYVIDGVARNRGLELSAERSFDAGWFLLANFTGFNSQYQGRDGLWRSTRWNLRHIANLTGGKAWEWDKNGTKSKTFGLNGRLSWMGGQRAMGINEQASEEASTTVFRLGEGFIYRYPDFLRLDLRVYWRRSIGNRRNSTFAMDFQNASIRRNMAYQYYDPFTNRVETKYQLGLIPNLSWRLEF